MGVICDQDTIAGASILTYTGTGMTYNGVPLVQSPISHTLILSADPACTVPGGDKISFPPAALCKLWCQPQTVRCGWCPGSPFASEVAVPHPLSATYPCGVLMLIL
jgi:hypothetical protein